MPEQKPAEAAEKGGKRIDLSMAQVVASALATMVGALLASELGVAGTVVGAAVVSVAATTSTAVFHHIFRRTGDQLRVAADRGPGAGAAAPPSDGPSGGPAITSDWNSSKVLRARPRRSWRSALVLPGLVFLLAMVPIVAFELATGQPVSATVQGGTGQGTSFGGSVHGTPSTKPSATPSPGSASSGAASSGAGAGASSTASAAPSTKPSSSPSAGQPSGPAGRPSAGSSPNAGSSPSGQASPDPAAPAPGGAATAPGEPPATP
ncbi:hypothetical protein [Streptomyces sp. CB03911]|uniref:hypothetical protein n=1 Tax=Streptomyces sp. CB03911 TaxID=1804758 RepID=UPI0018FE0951|nr:hypothetical protein [Streptomyces sp. CB03911]